MRDEGWLVSYRDIEGVRVTLARMSYRLSRRPHLEQATHFLIDARHELQHRFEAFFPDLIARFRRISY